jgi:hypothetical protein
MNNAEKRSLEFANRQSRESKKYDLKKAITIGTVATLGFLGVHTIENSQSANDQTQVAIKGIPNFNGITANKFLAKSSKTKEALRNGSMVEIYVDNIPFSDSKIPQPNSYDSIAEAITPKNGDIYAVADALATNQGTHKGENASVVVPGQAFIVNATPGAIDLARAEAKQGIY